MYDSYGDGWNGNTYDVSLGGVSIASGGLLSGFYGTSAVAVGVPAAQCNCTTSWATLSMNDSFGDGWNGNTWTATSNSGGSTYGPFTIASGFSGSESFCMDDDCYDLVCDFGAWQSEVSWTLTDANGTVLASGGAPYTGQISTGSANCCVYGCTDSTATNYDPLATCDDGSCTYCVYGCMDTTQFNYNPLATCDDGTCIPIFYGCTDSTAINYYSAANTNNGTCVYCIYGCTDPLATNYNSSATCDDGSCTYPASCNSPVPTGLSVTDLTHDRAKVNWASSNTSLCLVEMYRVQYREQGTTAWSTKTALGSGLCNFGLTTTSKMLWNLTPSTVYEYRAKAWYCSASASLWTSISTFTTLDVCPNVLNLAVSSGSNTQATFSWTAPTAPYSFVRIKLRVDNVGSAWFTAGGFGVMYPALTRNKNGLTPGQSYRASSRTWCNPSGGPHKALAWSSFIFWTQPGTLIRADDESSTINNLTIYPNPSRDVFNISFVSEEKQNLRVRILNVIGEEVYKEDLQQFIGEYVKSINLEQYNKAIYFLEIETDDGVITKKLILQ